MASKGKRLKAALAVIDRNKLHPLTDAVKAVKDAATAKFDETVELALALGVDPRHADQMVRGTVNLPHGTGKTLRVAVFARGDKADEAKAAGADIVGAEDLAETGPGGPDRFRPLHRHPRPDAAGRSPRSHPRPARPDAEPEAGDGDAQRPRGGRGGQGRPGQFRVEKAGIVHAGVGKASFGPTSWSPTSRPSSTRSTRPSRPAPKGRT